MDSHILLLFLIVSYFILDEHRFMYWFCNSCWLSNLSKQVPESWWTYSRCTGSGWLAGSTRRYFNIFSYYCDDTGTIKCSTHVCTYINPCCSYGSISWDCFVTCNYQDICFLSYLWKESSSKRVSQSPKHCDMKQWKMKKVWAIKCYRQIERSREYQ